MHQNNFDFLRLIFAISVMITHSYALAGVSNAEDVLWKLTNSSVTFSSLALSGFFAISGYLIYLSLKRSSSLFAYFKNRILRIYPALLVVLVLTAIFSVIVSSQSFTAHFSDSSVYSYVFKNLAMISDHTINGVFEQNPFPGNINGSLWTISYEFLFYIAIAFLFFFRKNEKLVLSLMIITFCFLFYLKINYLHRGLYYYIPYTSFRLEIIAEFGLYFIAGSILAIVNIKAFRYREFLLIAALVCTIVIMYMGQFTHAGYLLLPPIIILIGLKSTKGISGINNKMGDLSYGIYIYGFLIQQTLMYYFTLSPFQLMLFSIPLAIVFGYLSWNLVEKRVLKLKKAQPSIKTTSKNPHLLKTL